MKINRREFLLLTAGLAAGCKAVGDCEPPVAARIIKAGPASQYATDGVYANFRNRGFFVIRQGEKLFALSAICTHRKCRLDADPDKTFHCPCHGSTFSPDGKVTRGPARRDLPVLAVYTDENGDLLVTLPAS